MKPKLLYPTRWSRRSRASIAMLCAALIVTGSSPCHAQPSDSGADAEGSAARIPADQLDSLVAPIALYPDPLLAQVLAASTYPLEIIQLQQWLERNKGLKDQALVDAVQKQPWDTSVQAMAPLPDLVKRLADDIQWTTDLGNAFLAQQSDVMDAVQRMRQKAQANGNLQTTEQQTVQTKVIENKSVVVIEPASPEVVYVPSYNPTVVYGAPPAAYPYPAIYYPPPGYYAAGMVLTFGLGVAMGAAWGGGWGSCGWGGDNDVTINNNNSFNRNTVARGGDRAQVSPRGGSGKWQHNPQHRGGAPYGDRATANRYGGNARGDSLSTRQASARQQVGRQGGNLPSTREAGGAGGRSASTRDMGGGRAGGASQGMGGGRAGGTSQGMGSRGASGPDRAGSRNMSSGYGGRSDGFGGGGGGYSGASARAASSRGASSMGSRGGGGGGGFSGGGGGGGRGGGGGGGRGGGGGGGRGGGGGGRRR